VTGAVRGWRRIAMSEDEIAAEIARTARCLGV